MAKRLTADEQAFFQEQGYLLYDQPVFTPEKFAGLKRHFEGLLAGWEAEGRRPEHMDVPHFSEPKLFDWLFDDAVLDIVESLIGPDIALWSSHFICKQPGKGLRVPWHEDSAYWKGRLDPMEVVTIWLAIDPSTPSNGCMRVIPGTHGDGFSDYDILADPNAQVFGSEIKRGQFDEAKAVDCILEPNHCSIHHAKCIHGSNPNTGTVRRCGYTMRYMPASVKFLNDGGINETFQIYLARGKNIAGNHYADPSKPNEKWLAAGAPRLKIASH